MKYIRWFEDIAKTDIEQVGGKGANLGEMARAGLPVPPGFCLTAQAYQKFITETGIAESIQDILSDIDPQDSGRLSQAADVIRGLITDQSVPEGMAQELSQCYRALCENMGLTSGKQSAVAVRSSATAEDLPTASFAGQQDTYLNVRGEEQLLEYVKSCWASLWTDRATIYRTRQGFDHQKVYLAVVVQAMVPSEISGIMFTANPVDGDREVAVINASWGLGEAIVSGLVTPDTITVDKVRGEVVSRITASKDRCICYKDTGGVENLEVPDEKKEVPALTDRQASELAALGRKIEHHYGSPQDIEWAYANDRWYILQVRPVTTLSDESVGLLETEYNRSMFVEIFPDPLTPVFNSAINILFKSMLDFTFRTWGFKPPEGMQAVGVFYNQPYFSRNYIEAAFSPLSPAVRELLVSQVTNPFGDHKGGVQVEISIPYLRMLLNTLRFMLTFPKKLPGLLENYHAEVTRVEMQDEKMLTDQELVAVIKDMIYGFTRKLIDYDFLLIAVVKRVYHLLGLMLEPYFGVEAEAIRGKLISGITGNATMETNISLWDLAQRVKTSPELSRLVREYSGREIFDRLDASSDGRVFLEEMEKFLDRFGHREVRLDIIYPTWCEDPSPVLNFIRGYLELDSEQDPHLQQERLLQQRQELEDVVRERLGKKSKGRYVVWPLFHWLLQNIEFHTRERDTMHFEMTRVFPSFRRFLFDLGRRWTDQGILSEPEQIFFLTLDEMESTAIDPIPVGEMTRKRQEEFEKNKHRPWPDIIRGSREIYLRQVEPGKEDPRQLNGVPGSPGVITGRARVIRGPEEFYRLEKGDILVAPITNPVWTPLFAIASGVITEVGGILSHGAIVAREYGIPAVMSIASATQRVLDGETVTVDGDRGIVYQTAGSAV